MTYQQLILILCGYALVVAGGFLVGKIVPLPDHVERAKPNRKEILAQKSKLYLGVFTITSCLVVGAGIVGFIGLFFRWHLAPWIFAGSLAGKILLFPSVFWKVRSGLEDMFSDLELLLDGVILTLVFFGPARPLFFFDR